MAMASCISRNESQGNDISVNIYTHWAAHMDYIHQLGVNATIDLGGGNIIISLNTTATDPNPLSHIIW